MFAQRRKDKSKHTVSANPISSQDNDALFPHRLNWYATPPTHTISIDEFEFAAITRLRILKALDTAFLRNTPDDQLKLTLISLENEHLPLFANKSAHFSVLDNQRRLDLVSHFILQLAYARTHDNREWFIRLETLLFRLRLERECIQDRSLFVQSLNLDLEQVTPEEQLSLKNELNAASLASGDKLTPLDCSVYFKIHWTRILDLVGRRRCLVRNGYAYISLKDQIALVVNEFKAHLTNLVKITSRYLPRMDDDERITPVLTNLSTQYLGKEKYSTCGAGKNLKSHDIDQLAHSHFPLCMHHLHSQLKANGHLKHNGRLQLGLFIKGIGLPVEEALSFWRRHFRHVTDDTFRKEYQYNIRHSYGLEGHRKNYTPYSCISIITQRPPGVGDFHGCPYKTFGNENLKQLLVHFGIQEPGPLNEILQAAKAGHFQVACTKFAEVRSSNRARVEPIEHPNQFFMQSYLGVIKDGSGDTMDVDGNEVVLHSLQQPDDGMDLGE